MLGVLLSVTMVAWAGLMATTFVLAARGRRLEPGEKAIPRDEMRQHRLWLFYCNPDDPRGWVPKWRGPGMTVNVRTRGGGLVMLVFSLATLGGVIGTVGSAVSQVLGR